MIIGINSDDEFTKKKLKNIFKKYFEFQIFHNRIVCYYVIFKVVLFKSFFFFKTEEEK
jgi:hypothetical protein